MARLCNRRWCWLEWRWNACWCGNSLWLLTPGRAHGCDWSNAWGGCWRCGGGCRGNRVGLTLSCCNCEFSLWWWLLMVVTMALRWAIYGTWMGYLWHLELETWWVRDFGTRGFEHEIFFTRDFLNTNRTNNTNLFGTRGFLTRGFWHTDLTDFAYGTLNTRFFSHEIFWTRITRITRILFCTRISLSRILCSWCLNTNLTNNTNIFWHTDLIFFSTRISRILSLRLVVNDNSLWLLTRCGYWLVVVIDSLWLLTRYGYWLIVVIDLLWLLACYVLNDKSKKISVSHAKHWQIREIRVRNKNIRAIRSSCERTAVNKDPWDSWDPCASSLK